MPKLHNGGRGPGRDDARPAPSVTGWGFPTWLYSRISSNPGLEEKPDFGWDRGSGVRQPALRQLGSLRAQFLLPPCSSVRSLSWLGLPKRSSETKPPESLLGSQIPQ